MKITNNSTNNDLNRRFYEGKVILSYLMDSWLKVYTNTINSIKKTQKLRCESFKALERLKA